MTFIILYLTLGLMFGMSFSNVVFISLSVSLATYFIGDFIILPLTNNTVTTVSEFLMSFFLIWVITLVQMADPTYPYVLSSFVGALGLSIFAIFFHRYMERKILADKIEQGRTTSMQESYRMDMEFAEENFPRKDPKEEE